MTNPFTQFNYRDAQGQQRSARSSAQAPGFAGFDSEAIGPNGMTASGDARNPFRGFVSADGGRFGGYDSAVDPSNGLTQQQYDQRLAERRNALAPVDWSRTTDVSRRNVGGTGLSIADTKTRNTQIDALERRLVEGSGSDFTDDERALLQSRQGTTENPFRSAADMVRLGYDTQGNRVAGDADYYARLEAAGAATPEQAARLRQANQANIEGQARAEREAVDAANRAPARDPLGRNDDPTAANNVITPQTEARLRAQQERPMEPLDPFAPFVPNATNPAQVGQNPGVMMAQQGVQPATFGASPAPALPVSRSGDFALPNAGRSPDLAPVPSGMANIGSIPLPDLGGGNPTPAGQTPPSFQPFGSPLAGGAGAGSAGVPPAAGASPSGFGGGFRSLGQRMRQGTGNFMRPITPQRRRPFGGAAAPDPNAPQAPVSLQSL